MNSNNNSKKKQPKKRNNNVNRSTNENPRWTPKHTSCSKAASYLLRHGAHKEGLSLREDGFCKVEDLLAMKGMKPFNRQLLNETIEWNGKQRFLIKKENDIEWIRANQGHSIQVPKLELKEITDPSQYPNVLHGTYLKVWPLIKTEGLKRMSRNHIHFASGKFGEAKSGVRVNVEILIYIDIKQAINDGYKFVISENGVILCDGGKQGILPPKYITHAISTSNNQPFDPDFPKKRKDLSTLPLKKEEEEKQETKKEDKNPVWPGRTSEEVFNRLKWDQDYDPNECIIGYEDRFTGIQEIPLTSWEHRDVTADAFIPWHRVYYFKYKDATIWDREKKIDSVFGEKKEENNSKKIKKDISNNNNNNNTLRPSLEYIVVLDFEATCDTNKNFKPQEIIEFPSVLYNVKTQKVEAEFQKYITPTSQPKLTKFCTDLTGITQKQVDNGILLPLALKEYHKWLVSIGLIDENGKDLKNWCLCTCGDWDLNTMLPTQAKNLKLTILPYFKRFMNIKKVFAIKYGLKPMGMTGMLDYLKLTLDGRHHSGIDDCRNITKCLAEIIKHGIDSDLLQPTTDHIFKEQQKQIEKEQKEKVKNQNSGVDHKAVQFFVEKAKPFIGDKVFLDSLKLQKMETTSGREKVLGILTHYITSQLKKQNEGFSKISSETRKSFLITIKVSLLLPYLQENHKWPKIK